MISDWQKQAGEKMCLPSGLKSTVAGLSGESQVMMKGKDGACADYSALAAALQSLVDNCSTQDSDMNSIVEGEDAVPGTEGVGIEPYASEGGGMSL